MGQDVEKVEGERTIGFRSGASLSVETGPKGETIVLRSAGGAVDLTIRMTEQGPVLSLSGIRLEIAAADAVAVTCRQFSIRASEGIELESGGDLAVASDAEIRLKSRGSTYVDGDYVKLNCLDRDGYHDQAVEVPQPREDQPLAAD